MSRIHTECTDHSQSQYRRICTQHQVVHIKRRESRHGAPTATTNSAELRRKPSCTEANVTFEFSDERQRREEMLRKAPTPCRAYHPRVQHDLHVEHARQFVVRYISARSRSLLVYNGHQGWLRLWNLLGQIWHMVCGKALAELSLLSISVFLERNLWTFVDNHLE